MAALRRGVLAATAALLALAALTITIPVAHAQPVSYINSAAIPPPFDYACAVITYGDYVFIGGCEWAFHAGQD